MKTNGYLTSTLYTSESNGDVHLAPDAFLCYKSDSYLLFPLLHPSLERVWHPLSLILYGETMGSGGRSYYVSRSESGETEGVKAEWKLRERESVRGRKRAQKGDHLLTILSNHESDETLHEWQFLRPPSPSSLLFYSDAMSEKTATRNPSSRGKCKGKTRDCERMGPGFKQVPFSGFLWMSS